MDDKLMSADDVAELTGLTAQYLAVLRMNRKGPVHLKLGKAVRYRREDVMSWLESCAVATIP